MVFMRCFCYNRARNMKEFKVTIDAFDGPLDLMLHLIKEQKLDLMNLDMNVLTDQYIAYLNSMSSLHLEVASEYLAELATLIEYKSKKMLPGNKEELEDNYEEDPKEKLIKRLLEYQQYKEVSSQLNELFEDRQKHLSRPFSNEFQQWVSEDEPLTIKGNAYDLVKAMKRMYMRMRLQTPQSTSYTIKEVSMEDRELQVRSMLDQLPKTFSFEKLLEDVHDTPMFIATFLAVLDLARLHTLVFTIDENDTIWFTRGEHDGN